jgi:transposase
MVYINSYKDQNWLIPQSIRDMIPKNHICFFVEEFVDSLDFSDFDMVSEGAGHPSYPPRIPMKVIIQGMLSKERSSRKLANACRENFVFMYLAEKVQPEFSTICRFRRNNKEFIKEAFKETVKLADENGLVDLRLICTDGSKIKANASRKKFLKMEQLEQLDSIIDKMIENDIKEDETDKEIYGLKEENLTSMDTKNLKEIVKCYRKNKNKEELKKNCKRAKEEFIKDTKIERVSLTDPECRIMSHKDGSYKPSYNAQLTVDSKDQIIIANDVCQEREDSHQLKPQVMQVKENIGLKEGTKLAADSKYSYGENLKFMEDEKIDGYIPNQSQASILNEKKQEGKKQDDYEYDRERDEIIVNGVRMYYLSTHFDKNKKCNLHRYRSWEDAKINRTVPEFFIERLRMRDKMETEEAKKIYNLRKIVIEPVIGNIKENLGFWEFKSRGLDGAKLELNLISIAHNLKKIWKVRGRISINNKIIVFDLIINNNQLIVAQPDLSS